MKSAEKMAFLTISDPVGRSDGPCCPADFKIGNEIKGLEHISCGTAVKQRWNRSGSVHMRLQIAAGRFEAGQSGHLPSASSSVCCGGSGALFWRSGRAGEGRRRFCLPGGLCSGWAEPWPTPVCREGGSVSRRARAEGRRRGRRARRIRSQKRRRRRPRRRGTADVTWWRVH